MTSALAGKGSESSANMEQPQIEYVVEARRIDSDGSVAQCKDTTVQLDTSVSGRVDAFNPVELLLAALSACMIKGLARVAPMLDFDYRNVSVKLRASRQNVPPRIARIEYEIMVETEETDHRLNLLHENIRKFGTVSNTVAAGTSLTGTICRIARR
jgi:uncharacterized OsmC-like protein